MWKDKYKINVPLIDEQHEELFARVSSFIKTVQGEGKWEDKRDKVKETLKFMKEYVVFHFSDEEEYQEQINYPLTEIHKQRHSQFKESVGSYADRFEKEGLTEELVKEFGGKLMTWVILHVQAEDQKIGEYVQSKGGND